MDNQFLNTTASDSNSRGVTPTNMGGEGQQPQPLQTVTAQPTPIVTSPQPAPLQVGPTPTATEWQQSTPPQKPKTPSLLSRLSPRAKLIGAVILVLLILAGGIAVVLVNMGRNNDAAVLSSQSAQNFTTLNIPLGGINGAGAITVGNRTLNVNGQLRANGSLVMTPSVRPAQPVTGQIYYDQTDNRLLYYNGSTFVQLQTSADTQGASTTNNVTNSVVNNIIQGGGTDTSGFARLAATQTFTGANTFRTNSSAALDVQTAGGTSLLAVNTSSSSVTVGATSAAANVTLGSSVGGSSTTLRSGTGDLSVTTGANTGVSGSIAITTGNSTTTASGNITIDTGSGVIDGEVIEDKTFESGLDNMNPWFGSTIAQSSAQAHSGLESLQMTATDVFWGVIETFPGTTVTAGHQYYFSAWVRAGTTPRSITGRAMWNGTGTNVPLTTVVDSTTGWTQMTALATAPAGANSVYFEFQSTSAVGEVHYFDDITITDLSSASAISAISIGATNAKIITIGNINEIGATSIYGGSGINLTSGAGPITLNGGVVTLTGNAASSINTTAGALSITSAAAATWGVGTASSGAGQDLTLRGGSGASGNNNGGQLLLQGGNATGTGIGGGVVVKPQKDSPNAFQIQDSTSTPLFVADTTSKTLSVQGTTSSFATLTLANAHFSSTQTNPPTISAPTNCGTTPTATLTPGSTDSAGSFVVTAGSGAIAGPCTLTLSFNQTYGTAPKSVIITPTTAVGTSAQGKAAIVTATTATDFTAAINPTNPAASEVNSYYYWVIK